MSTDRVNFMERQTFVVTYRKMGLALAGVVLLELLVVGGQAARTLFLNRKIGHLTEQINTLKAERQKVLMKVAQESGGGAASAQSALRATFETEPVWSEVLKSLSDEIPTSVWLASLKTYEKAESPSGRGIILIGEATSAAEVSRFVRLLSANRFFKEVVLSASQEEEGSAGSVQYRFTVEALVAPGRET